MLKNDQPKLCLVDASGYIHRAYHALPPMTTSQGLPVNAVYGFSRMISKLLKTENPDYLAICFDTPAPTFRHEMYKEYKETRAQTDESLIAQLPVVEELSLAWGLPCVKQDGLEADDVIATLTKEAVKLGWRVLILSGDKDILQLVDDNVLVRDEIRKVDFTADKVRERFGISPNQIVDYFSLMGDKVDNVIGIPGVGEKTAAKLLSTYPTLEDLYKNLKGENEPLKKKMMPYKETVFRNRTLIQLKCDADLGVSMQNLTVKPPQGETLKNILKHLEFRGDLVGAGSAVLESSLETNKERKVRVVLTDEDLEQLKKVLLSSELVSYDLETTSLNPYTCDIVGISLCVKPHEAWYIPVGHSYIGVPAQLPWTQLFPLLKKVLEDPRVVKYGQNLKFDDAILARHGIFPQGPWFDTLIASYCLDASRNSYGLKDLAADYLNERMVRYEELVGKTKRSISEVKIEDVASYAGADSEVVLRLAKIFEEKLKQENLNELFEKLEMPLVQVLQTMEAAGIKVDIPYLETIKVKFAGKKRVLEKEIFEMAGGEFSLNSPQQLGRVLFEKLKLPPGKRTKTGYSTNEAVLIQLAEKHPICEKIIDYREFSKLSSTYIESLLELADPKSRVHTSFHQTGTATGRLSSNSPNLQNIPIRTEPGREIRKAFIASEGCVLVSADYSQIDLRSLAHVSEDSVLLKTFEEGGDVHAATASQIFHVSMEQLTPEMRRRAKAINFGIVYGQQAWGLSQGLGIDVKEAETFIKNYFEKYAGVKKWIENTLEKARQTGFVSTLAGRKRKIEGLQSDNFSQRGFAERIAINTPIQGSSADIIKAAMIKIDKDLRAKKFRTQMLVQVHDELLFDVPEDELEKVLSLIQEDMEGAMSLRIPLVVDMKKGLNWNDMEKIPREVHS